MTTLIGADIEHLRATIAAMRRGSANIESAFQQATQAMATLQNSRWSGQHRQQAEELWTRLQARFTPTLETLNQIATRIERFTDALEEAGRVFGDGGTPIGPRLPTNVSFFAEWNKMFGVMGATLFLNLAGRVVERLVQNLDTIESLKDFGDTYKSLRLIGTLQLREGSHYADQVIIRGSREARKELFINPFTNHFKVSPTRITNQINAGVVDVTKAGVLSTTLFSLIKYGYKNYHTYKDDAQSFQKIASATIIDTSIKTGIVAATTAGGAYIGGAVGAAVGTALLGPVGTVIGSAAGTHIGGFLGGLAGDWMADKLMEQEFYKDSKEGAVQSMADNIDKGVEYINEGVERAKNAFSEHINQVDNTIKKYTTDFVNLFR